MNKQHKKPQKPKTLIAEEKRQRVLVKNILWPFLVEHSKNINDARNILEASVVGIQQAYDMAMLVEQTRLSKLNMDEYEIDKTILNTHDYKVEHALIKLFATESLATTKGLLQGMSRVLDSFIKEEMAHRTLDTLKTDFLN